MRYLLTIIALLSTLAVWGQGFSDPKQQHNKLNKVFSIINSLYVEQVDMQPLVEEAIVAMLEGLDPHSKYLNPEELAMESGLMSGKFSGIGITNQMVYDTLRVISVNDSSPAQRAGLRAGDRIIRIDTIRAVGIENPSRYIRGKEGTEVELEVVRRGIDSTLRFNIVRRNIVTHSAEVAYMVNPSTLYVKINQFGRNLSDELRAAITAHKGAKNLIIDLQGNGGGLLQEAQGVAGIMLEKGLEVVSTSGRSVSSRSLTSPDGKKFEGRVVILVDENSASASEIVAGAVQDWDRGVIVGKPTFGKGLVQRQFELADGSAVRLTIAHYYTPSGRDIQRPYRRGESEEYYLNHSERVYGKDNSPATDSLPKYLTLRKQRVVRGGGGIIPDIITEDDTTHITSYLKSLSARNLILGFTLDYLDSHREELLEEYPDYEEWERGYEIKERLFEELYDYAAHRGIEFNEGESKTSEPIIEKQLRAYLAWSLYGHKYRIRAYNSSEGNSSLNRALELLDSKREYNEILSIE